MQPGKDSATLFINRDSWLLKLHPFTKLSYILITGTLAYAGPVDWKFTGLLILINISIIVSGGLIKETFQALLRIMLPLILFMVPIHSFLYPGNSTILFSVSGLIAYQEGFCFALTTLVKLTIVLMTSLLFVFSTHPADLITSLSQTGKSPSLAYLIGSPLLLLAGMRERIQIIQAAQQARGLDTGANVFKRVFSLVPLIIPLVTGAIVEVEQRSIALEVRGFKSPAAKTSFRNLPDSKLQRLARWFMFSAAGLILFSHLLV